MRQWSSPMPVTHVMTGLVALVASQRPPSPTSSTATSTPASAKTTQAATVSRSNSVTRKRRSPERSRRAFTRRPASAAREMPRANASRETGAPVTSMRSRISTSSGEVYRAHESPCPERMTAV